MSLLLRLVLLHVPSGRRPAAVVTTARHRAVAWMAGDRFIMSRTRFGCNIGTSATPFHDLLPPYPSRSNNKQALPGLDSHRSASQHAPVASLPLVCGKLGKFLRGCFVFQLSEVWATDGTTGNQISGLALQIFRDFNDIFSSRRHDETETAAAIRLLVCYGSKRRVNLLVHTVWVVQDEP